MAENVGRGAKGADNPAVNRKSEESDPTYNAAEENERHRRAWKKGDGGVSANDGSFNPEEWLENIAKGNLQDIAKGNQDDSGKTTKWYKCCLL